MSNKYLLIVEGSKTEPTIFQQVLEKYGYNVIICKEKLELEGIGQFDRINYKSDKNNIVIIQGPRNRIHDFLLAYNSNIDAIQNAFHMQYEVFQGIFLIYDVDHNSPEDIVEMYNKFNDESSGMLLLSSPCIEVLGDYNHNRDELKYNHLKEYKAELNKYYEKFKTNITEYIINNFEELCLYYLTLNKNEFNEDNILEHPRLIINNINKYNDRINYSYDKDKSYVIYRYFTTVIYVFIAYINGLTKEIDNYSIVKSWFESKSK